MSFRLLRWKKAIGTREADAVGIGPVELPVFDGHHRGIRAVRMRLGIGLRLAARVLGMTARELSAVERGEAEWIDGSSYADAIRRLEYEAQLLEKVRRMAAGDGDRK